MQFFRRISRFVAPFMAALMVVLSIPMGAAQAGLVSTDVLIEQAQSDGELARVLDFIGRDEIREQIRSLGVDPDEAEARVSALSNIEISRLAGRIDALPAGQDVVGGIIGAAVLIFLVLLITDLLGLTDVYSFVKR
jgi:hypothetical protein